MPSGDYRKGQEDMDIHEVICEKSTQEKENREEFDRGTILLKADIQKKITYDRIRKDPEINLLIEKGNEILGILGYTEHSAKHAAKVAKNSGDILKKLGYGKRTIELSKIAGYMHDIGNSINRRDHAHSGAILAYQLLKERNMSLTEAITVASAIGNHDESTGTAVDAVSAALIIADKTDVRYTRVRNRDIAKFDIHDRVNYSVKESRVEIVKGSHIELELKIDTEMCSVMDYFEIFLDRMILCRKAAEKLGLSFWLVINGQRMI